MQLWRRALMGSTWIGLTHIRRRTRAGTRTIWYVLSAGSRSMLARTHHWARILALLYKTRRNWLYITRTMCGWLLVLVVRRSIFRRQIGQQRSRPAPQWSAIWIFSSRT